MTSKQFLLSLKILQHYTLSFSKLGATANERGLFIRYRMAEAALDQQTLKLARGFKINGDNIRIIALNAGYIATKMTVFKSVVDMEESVQNMVNIIENAPLEQSSHLFDYTGNELPF